MPALSLDDGTIRYEELGTGPPLVFLHGGWLDGNVWDPQVERFAEDYRLIVPDIRGHGRTGATDRERYSVDLFTNDLERVLAAAGVDRPTFCGLSLGNLVVQEYLNRHHDTARGAILGGPLRSMPPLDLPAGAKPFLSPMAGLSTSLCLTGSKSTFRSLLWSIRSATGRPWLSVDRSVRSEVIDDVGRIPRSEFRKIFEAIYRFDPPDLSHVSTPTLAVYGESESPLVKRQGRQITRMVEAGSYVSVPDAAHLVNVDNAKRFNATVADFLDGSAMAAS